MKYVPPYGRESEGDTASYINGDPSIARQGSIPPAEAFEHPMRELVNIITDSQLVPSDTDLEQTAKGIRSQRMNYVEDTGSVNTLSVALDPPLTGYSIGLPLRVKIKNTNTGPSTIDAGAGRVSIKKPTGAEVQPGDLPASGLAELVYDGTYFQMINFGGAGAGGGTSIVLANIPYTVDTSLTANTVIANFSPAITALSAGTIFMVKVANTNTSFANINVNGLGLKPIYAQGGSPNWPLLPSDMVAGDVLVFVYDGTHFWIYANTIINQSVSFTVTNNADLQALFVALGRKRILANAGVTINMAIGIYSPGITTAHPNAERIVLTGTMRAAVPGFADFARTGNSPAARANDSANNIVMLRSRFGTEIQFNNTAGTNFAIAHSGAGAINYQNLLITGQNVDAGATSPIVIGVASGSGAINLTNVCVWGSGSYGFSADGAVLRLNNCFACGCFNSGFVAVRAGSFVLSGCGSYGNVIAGAWVSAGCNAQFWSYTGVPGVSDTPPSQLQCNGSYGAYAFSGGSIENVRGNTTSNGVCDLIAINAGGIYLTGSVVYGTTSPAVNVQGNNYAIITQ